MSSFRICGCMLSWTLLNIRACRLACVHNLTFNILHIKKKEKNCHTQNDTLNKKRYEKNWLNCVIIDNFGNCHLFLLLPFSMLTLIWIEWYGCDSVNCALACDRIDTKAYKFLICFFLFFFLAQHGAHYSSKSSRLHGCRTAIWLRDRDKIRRRVIDLPDQHQGFSVFSR